MPMIEKYHVSQASDSARLRKRFKTFTRTTQSNSPSVIKENEHESDKDRCARSYNRLHPLILAVFWYYATWRAMRHPRIFPRIWTVLASEEHHDRASLGTTLFDAL